MTRNGRRALFALGEPWFPRRSILRPLVRSGDAESRGSPPWRRSSVPKPRLDALIAVWHIPAEVVRRRCERLDGYVRRASCTWRRTRYYAWDVRRGAVLSAATAAPSGPLLPALP